MSLRARLVAAVCVVSLVALGSAGDRDLRAVLTVAASSDRRLVAAHPRTVGDSGRLRARRRRRPTRHRDRQRRRNDRRRGRRHRCRPRSRPLDRATRTWSARHRARSRQCRRSLLCPPASLGHEPLVDRRRRSHAAAREHRRFPRPAVVLHADRRDDPTDDAGAVSRLPDGSVLVIGRLDCTKRASPRGDS